MTIISLRFPRLIELGGIKNERCFCCTCFTGLVTAAPRRQHYEESDGSTTEMDEDTDGEATEEGSASEEEVSSPPRKSQRRSCDTTARQGRPAGTSRTRDRGRRRGTEESEGEEEVSTSRGGASRRAPSDLSVRMSNQCIVIIAVCCNFQCYRTQACLKF